MKKYKFKNEKAEKFYLQLYGAILTSLILIVLYFITCFTIIIFG